MPKNRMFLLKDLRDLLSDHLDDIRIDTTSPDDIDEFITMITCKKRHRKLKKLRKELDLFISEYKQLRKESHAESTID